MISPAFSRSQQEATPTPSAFESTHLDISESTGTVVVGPSDKCGSTVCACPNHMAPADAHAAVGQHANTSRLLHSSDELQPSSADEADVMQTEQLLQQPGRKQPTASAETDGASIHQQQRVQQQGPVQEQSDSEDDSWTPGQQQSNADVAYEQEEMWDPNGRPAQYCANCTAPLYGLQCSDCGHSSELDSALFQCDSPRPLRSDTAASGRGPVIVWDDDMLLHEEGKAVPHPERPDRLRAIMGHLTGHGLTGHCVRVPARAATKQELLRVHTPDHLQRLQMFCSGTIPATNIPSDTYINQHTLHCAALAAGSAAEVAVRVVQGQSNHGAAIIRPPGHHAESNTAMGFCFFNNAAVAARAAQAAGAERVLILDWDVHHGNGTQHIFEADPSVLYMSLHRYDRGNFYPGTGAADEVGFGRGAGYTVNVPWDAGNIGDGDYLAAMQQVLLPIAREFAPNLIIISAGFDAADGDPIGGCCLTPFCFGSMTAELMDIAPSVLLLEGGYNLLSTAVSTEACLRVLLGEAPRLPAAPRPSPFGWLAIQAAKKAHSRYWSCLAGAFPQLHQHGPGQQLHRLMGYGSSSREQVEGELELGDEYEEDEYVDEDEDEDGADEQEVDDGGQGGLDPVEGVGGGLMLGHEGAGHRGAGWGGTRQSHTGSSSYAAPAAAVGSAAGQRGWQQRGQSQQARQPEQQRRRRLHGLSRKQQILHAIHRKAMAIFWRRRFKHIACQQQRQQQQQQKRRQGLEELPVHD